MTSGDSAGRSGTTFRLTETSALPFVLVASQRTGSTLLVRSLDSSPRIFCAGELFHAGPGIHHPEYQFPYRLCGSRWLARARDQLAPASRVASHLRAFYARASAGVAAVGFKLMVSQATSHPHVLPYLCSQNAIRLFLCRQDHFATALSYYKARASGVFHSDRLHRKTQDLDLVADVGDFDRIFRVCKQDFDRLIALHATIGGHLLTFEDMSNDWDSFIFRVGKLLGLEDLVVAKSLSRLGDDSSGVRVLNEEELRQHFTV